MKISLAPQRRDDALSLAKAGDVLTINGDVFDFSTLPDGATIPAGTVPCDWIIGPVERVGGMLSLMLLLPHGPNPPQHVAFPEPIINPDDGEIALPKETADVGA